MSESETIEVKTISPSNDDTNNNNNNASAAIASSAPKPSSSSNNNNDNNDENQEQENPADLIPDSSPSRGQTVDSAALRRMNSFEQAEFDRRTADAKKFHRSHVHPSSGPNGLTGGNHHTTTYHSVGGSGHNTSSSSSRASPGYPRSIHQHETWRYNYPYRENVEAGRRITMSLMCCSLVTTASLIICAVLVDQVGTVLWALMSAALVGTLYLSFECYRDKSISLTWNLYKSRIEVFFGTMFCCYCFDHFYKIPFTNISALEVSLERKSLPWIQESPMLCLKHPCDPCCCKDTIAYWSIRLRFSDPEKEKKEKEKEKQKEEQELQEKKKQQQKEEAKEAKEKEEKSKEQEQENGNENDKEQQQKGEEETAAAAEGEKKKEEEEETEVEKQQEHHTHSPNSTSAVVPIPSSKEEVPSKNFCCCTKGDSSSSNNNNNNNKNNNNHNYIPKQKHKKEEDLPFPYEAVEVERIVCKDGDPSDFEALAKKEKLLEQWSYFLERYHIYNVPVVEQGATTEGSVMLWNDD